MAAIIIAALSLAGCNLFVSLFDNNHSPVANAGDDIEVEVGTLTEIDGSGSSDPDGDPLSFVWEVSGIPERSEVTTNSLSDRFMEKAVFVPDVEGTFVIRLTVGDGSENDHDTVSVFAVRDIPVTPTPPDVPTPVSTSEPATSPAPTEPSTVTPYPSGQPTGPVITPEPSPLNAAAIYLFEGTLDDSSGNENHGTAHGTGQFTAGRFQTPVMAYGFDGSSAWIDCGNGSSLDFNDAISIVLWCAPGDASFHTILDMMSPDGSAGYALTIRNREVSFLRHGTTIVTGDTSAYRPNQWIFIAVTWEPGVSPPKMYIGGLSAPIPAEPVIGTDMDPWIVANVPLHIGLERNGTAYFNGIIDDLVIYNAALTEEMISVWYSNTKAGRISVKKE